jgi:hypothetical protein
MIGVLVSVVITWILSRVTLIDKGWLWFFCALGIIGQLTRKDIGMIGFLVAVGVFKVLKDVFRKRPD